MEGICVMVLNNQLEDDLGLSEQFLITETEEFPSEKKSFFNRNKVGLTTMVVGTIADIATTALILNGQYGTEENSLPNFLMKNYGVLGGQAILKSAMFSAYLLATCAVSPILDKIFKSNDSENKALYFGGVTQLAISGINLLSYSGADI